MLGPRWQILDAGGAVIGDSTTPLPVTAAARLVAAVAVTPHRPQGTVVTITLPGRTADGPD